MSPEKRYDDRRPADTLILDIYPDANSAFELYEDDGSTHHYKTGAWAKTRITCSAPATGEAGEIILNIGPSQGEYHGKPALRAWIVQIHTPHVPAGVLLDEKNVAPAPGILALKQVPGGYFYQADTLGGVLFIKTPSIPADHQLTIRTQPAGKTKKH